jgi:hypothetical protein
MWCLCTVCTLVSAVYREFLLSDVNKLHTYLLHCSPDYCVVLLSNVYVNFRKGAPVQIRRPQVLPNMCSDNLHCGFNLMIRYSTLTHSRLKTL